jgi:hypothetical protein
MAGVGSESRIGARRAIEALRAGVPNRNAVAALGSAQPEAEGRFRQLLQAAAAGMARDAQAPGLLVAGDFGSGKSHLLEHFEYLALEARFVCSRIVISKETPLHDSAKLFRAAIESAVVPDRRGPALADIAAGLDFSSEPVAAFTRWAHQAASGVNSRFPATLFLYERVNDAEVLDRIVSFWAGDPLNVGDVRRWLRAHDETATYTLERVPSKELPLHRFRFIPRLMAAAGYGGWVLLVDELELVGRYSFMQRARSYAALARWAGRLEAEAFPGLASVFAITSDFAEAVLEQRNDLEVVPGKLRVSGLEPESLLASQAERGMRLIAREAVNLRPPDRPAIDAARQRVRDLHARAYEWDPAALRPDDQLSSTSMRQYVRRWINEWDLKRLDPGYTGETMVLESLAMDYSEQVELDAPAEANGAAGASGPGDDQGGYPHRTSARTEGDDDARPLP